MEDRQVPRTADEAEDPNRPLEFTNVIPSPESSPKPKPTLENQKPLRNCIQSIRSHDFDGSWTWEILCAIVSLICIALLIAFLATVNGKKYKDWQYTIAPNTVVSIVVAFSKAAMLVPVTACIGQLKWGRKRGQQQSPTELYDFHVLDQASRGPWGAMQVFWHVASLLPMLGAILVIFSLAIDPFAQQILAFPSREVVVFNGSATIQRAHEYFPQWASQAYSNGFNNWYRIRQLDPNMQLAVLNGLAQKGTALDPKCPSSRCEYPEFATLGICSTCQDVTEESNQTCVSVPESALSYHGPVMPEGALADAPVNCTYSSPNGLKINPLPTSFAIQGKDSYKVSRVPWNSVTSTSLFTQLIEEKDGNATDILQMLAAQYPERENYVIYTPENSTKPEKKPSLSQCSVYFCEQQFPNSTYTSSDHKSPQPSRSQALEFDFARQLQPVEGPIADIKALYMFHPLNESKTYSTNSTYTIETETMSDLVELLQSLFNITENGFGNSNKQGTPMAVLATSQNISESMDSMATSMTNVIRQNLAASHVPGQLYYNETFIQVRWPWIIYPVALIVISIVFMSTTAVANRGQPVLWKSSIFPLLLGELEVTPEKQKIANLRHMEEIYHESKNIQVMVHDREDQPLLFVGQ